MLNDKEKRILKNLEKRMSLPEWKFILIYGVLAWGIVTALMYTALMRMIEKTPIDEIMRKQIWLNLLFFGLGGILYGWLMRKYFLKKFQKLKAKESSV